MTATQPLEGVQPRFSVSTKVHALGPSPASELEGASVLASVPASAPSRGASPVASAEASMPGAPPLPPAPPDPPAPPVVTVPVGPVPTVVDEVVLDELVLPVATPEPAVIGPPVVEGEPPGGSGC